LLGVEVEAAINNPVERVNLPQTFAINT
jgi:hypothetical protein